MPNYPELLILLLFLFYVTPIAMIPALAIYATLFHPTDLRQMTL